MSELPNIQGAGPNSTLTLSILDQSPVSAGSTPADALQHSIALARLADALGYHRFWMSEHHAMETLACTAPEIMLARLGAEATRVRIGSGEIMLPHYSAFKVAEVFRMLHALYPGRIDLGIGRAPGGGPIETLALSRDRKRGVPDDFVDQVRELLAFLGAGGEGDFAFPAAHPFSQLRVSPAMPGGPAVWMLGSSMWSAVVAAQLGLPYSFAHFFSPVPTAQAISTYRSSFSPAGLCSRSEATVAVGVICADTAEEAAYLHSSVRLLQRRIRLGDRRPVAAPDVAINELRLMGEVSGQSPSAEEGEWPRYFVGTPETVRDTLLQMANALGIREVLVNTITWDPTARLHSYELLSRAFRQQAVEHSAEPAVAL